MDETDYARQIATVFIDRRGRGTALSSADQQLLWQWERDGLSIDDVLRGIDEAFARKREPPASLRACRRWIEARANDDQKNAAVRSTVGVSGALRSMGVAQPDGERHGPTEDAESGGVDSASQLVRGLGGAPNDTPQSAPAHDDDNDVRACVDETEFAACAPGLHRALCAIRDRHANEVVRGAAAELLALVCAEAMARPLDAFGLAEVPGRLAELLRARMDDDARGALDREVWAHPRVRSAPSVVARQRALRQIEMERVLAAWDVALDGGDSGRHD
jgi:hypothetical protein